MKITLFSLRSVSLEFLSFDAKKFEVSLRTCIEARHIIA